MAVLGAVGAEQVVLGIHQLHEFLGDVVLTALVRNLDSIDLEHFLALGNQLADGGADHVGMGIGQEQAALAGVSREERDAATVGMRGVDSFELCI